LTTGLFTTHRSTKGNALLSKRKALQRSSLKCFRGVANRESSDEVFRGLQFDQGPRVRNVGMWSDRDQRGGKLRADFDVEAVQRKVQSQSFTLQQRFFAGPAAIEAGEPLRRRKLVESLQLARRKMVRGDVRVNGANMLDVDAQGKITADGEHCQTGAMGQVELDLLRAWVGFNLRLAIGAAGKGDLIPGNATIAAQQDAHGSMGDDVAIAMLGIYKSAGAKGFFFAEDLPVGVERVTIQVPGPHVDAVGSERGSGFGMRPAKDLCSHANFLFKQRFRQNSRCRFQPVVQKNIQFQVSERTPISIGSKR
jgi:hypothetical protein